MIPDSCPRKTGEGTCSELAVYHKECCNEKGELQCPPFRGIAGPFIMPEYIFHCWKCGVDLPQFLIDEGYHCKCKQPEWVRFAQQGAMRPHKFLWWRWWTKC
jgi:hypothetical protein